MHRTGSSAITRVLNLLGCDTAHTLMGPDENNQSGYWESDVLRVFNDNLLASGGSDWRDWLAFNPAWYDTARLDEHLARGKELLKAEYGEAKFFAFKDPRVTRIFPFWRRLFAETGTGLHVILTLRHPAEVAGSLVARDKMTPLEAVLMWLRNVLDAEHDSRGLPRAVVDYDDFISAPSKTMVAIQKPLDVSWPRYSERVAEEIDTFVTPQLRHHKVDEPSSFTDSLPLRAWLSEAWEILHRWAEHGEDPNDYAALDALREMLDKLATPLRETVKVIRTQAASLAENDRDIAYLRGEAGKRGDAVKALTAEKTALLAEQEKSRSMAAETLSQARADLEASQAALSECRESLAALTDEKAALQTALDDARSAHADAEGRLSALVETARKDAEQAGMRERELDQLVTDGENKLGLAMEDLGTLRDELSRTQSELRQRALEAEELAVELARLNRNMETLSTEKAALDQELAIRTEEITTLQRDIGTLREAREREQNDRFAEITRLGRAFFEQYGMLQQKLTQVRTLEAQVADLQQKAARVAPLEGLVTEGKTAATQIGEAIERVLKLGERPWLPPRRTLQRKARLLRALGLFDADWYISANPDVAASKADPAMHFVQYGLAEGRAPLPSVAQLRVTSGQEPAAPASNWELRGAPSRSATPPTMDER